MKRYIIGLFLLIATTAGAYQASIVVPNGTGAQVRANTNNALMAVSTTQSATSAPSTTYAYQGWIDTSTTPATYKIRNSGNTAWITIGTLNDTGPLFTAANAVNATYATYLNGQLASYYLPTTSYTAADVYSKLNSNAQRINWGIKPAFRGALVYGQSSATDTNVLWLAAAYDTDNIYSSADTTKLTVPTGVTKIRLIAQLYGSSVLSTVINKNSGVACPGRPYGVRMSGMQSITLASPVMAVTAGDYFQVYVTGALTAYSGDLAWFAMEIIE